jgi:acetyltransferase-like isoleucine patch superfamily enzyme
MKKWLIAVIQLIFTLLMYVLAIVYFGMAATPGVILFNIVYGKIGSLDIFLKGLICALLIACAYFIFGLTLVFLVGLTRSLLRLRLKEGTYNIFSKNALIWSFVSILYLMINFTFIDYILLTPFSNILLKMLGAKVGKNVQINSKYVYDATLLEIGDNTVIGGGAIIIGHVVERGRLKLKKVVIGKNVTIGSHATVMPGCRIGDNAIIGAGAILLKNTTVEPRSVWYGVPAKSIRERDKQ